MFTVEYTEQAIKDLNNLPVEIRKRVDNKLTKIKGNPKIYVKQLETPSAIPTYSLRVGKYRVLINIIRSKLIIRVVGAGLRNKVYQKMK